MFSFQQIAESNPLVNVKEDIHNLQNEYSADDAIYQSKIKVVRRD